MVMLPATRELILVLEISLQQLAQHMDRLEEQHLRELEELVEMATQNHHIVHC